MTYCCQEKRTCICQSLSLVTQGKSETNSCPYHRKKCDTDSMCQLSEELHANAFKEWQDQQKDDVVAKHVKVFDRSPETELSNYKTTWMTWGEKDTLQTRKTRENLDTSDTNSCWEFTGPETWTSQRPTFTTSKSDKIDGLKIESPPLLSRSGIVYRYQHLT